MLIVYSKSHPLKIKKYSKSQTDNDFAGTSPAWLIIYAILYVSFSLSFVEFKSWTGKLT